MDADLQDPLAAALAMLGKWEEGYDVVYGVRASREGETWFKRLTAYLYYRLLSGLSRHPLPHDVGDFRLLSRRALLALRRCPEHNRYLRGLVAWLGFPHASVCYHRQARRHGRTKFSLGWMLRFAATGFLSFSPAPLLVAPALGLALAGGGLVLLLYGLLSARAAPPDATLPLLLGIVMPLFGTCFLLIGILGAYLGRIYAEVCRRPLYLLSDTTDADDDASRSRQLRVNGPAPNDVHEPPPVRKARPAPASLGAPSSPRMTSL
jgi:dolichol-phosphate mannosyltransferase